MGKEYIIIGESIAGGKIIYEFNLKFYSLAQKLLNPELTLNQQLSTKEPNIIVKEIIIWKNLKLKYLKKLNLQKLILHLIKLKNKLYNLDI